MYGLVPCEETCPQGAITTLYEIFQEEHCGVDSLCSGKGG